MNDKKPGKFFESETGLVDPRSRHRINYDRWQSLGDSKPFTTSTTVTDPTVSDMVPGEAATV